MLYVNELVEMNKSNLMVVIDMMKEKIVNKYGDFFLILV